MKKYTRVKGCCDIYDQAEDRWRQAYLWQWLESKVNSISNLYGFERIVTPAFEHTDLFTRNVGEGTDIVSKEMYTFNDKGGRSLSLRPELTAPVLRALIENGLLQQAQNRFFYFGSCWRYDRPQAGRLRQFNQFGVEIVGQRDPMVDVEAISLLVDFYKSLGLTQFQLLISSIGDKETRKTYSNALKEHLKPNFDSLSDDSKKRFENTPMRILDSKDTGDQKLAKTAPSIAEFLSNEAKDHFHQVCHLLDALGIEYTIDRTIVRGLDYYCDTVFEVVSNSDSAAQNTLGAGGRYDGLIKQMGGPELPGVGFATGIERVLQALLVNEISLPEKRGPKYYFIPLLTDSSDFCFRSMMKFRQAGISSMLHLKNFNIKKGLQTATTLNAENAIIIGEEEFKSKTLKIKNLESREEETHPFSYIDQLSTNLFKGEPDANRRKSTYST